MNIIRKRIISIVICITMFCSLIICVNATTEFTVLSLDEAVSSTRNWVQNGVTDVTTKEGQLTVSGNGALATYNDYNQELHNKILDFTLKTNIDDGMWSGIFLRTQSGKETFWTSDTPECYGVVFKKDVIELKKTGKVLKTVPDVIKSNVFSQIQFGAIDVDGNVRIVLNIDGKSVLDYLDTDNPCMRPGDFSIYAFTCPVTIATKIPAIPVYYMDDAVTSADNWVASSESKIDQTTGAITLSGTNAVASYASANSDIHNKLLTFIIHTDISADDRVVALSLRNTSVAKLALDDKENSNYNIVLKKSEFKLQKNIKGKNTELQTIPNKIFKSNRNQKIQFGAVDTADGVRIIFKIDGVVVFDYVDKVDTVKDQGNFTIIAYNKPLTIASVSPVIIEDDTKLLQDNRPSKEVVYTFTGNTYYVDSNGSDDGNGTKNAPWKTIAFAASKVEANKDHTIRVAEGTYKETKQIKLKSGVNLVGAGREKSIVECNYNGIALLQEYGTKNLIAGFTFDGLKHYSISAIKVNRAKDLVATDLFIHDFKTNGALFLGVKNANLYNLIFKNNTTVYPQTNGDTAAIEITGSDSEFHDSVIVESVGKGMSVGPNQQDGTVASEIDMGKLMHNFKFYNLNINVPKTGNWEAPGTGYYPCQIAMEIISTDVENVEIYNCVFNNNISMVAGNKSNKPTYKLHNNYFDMQGYAFEIGPVNNMEIYNNVVEGGSDEFATWGNVANNNKVHRNIFTLYGKGNMLFTLSAPYNNFNFTNNTVILKEDGNLYHINAKDQQGFEIKNNLFVYEDNGKKAKNVPTTKSNINVDSNLYFNMPQIPQDVNPIIGDPMFKKTGDTLQEQYSLNAGSIAIDKGKQLQFETVSDGKPDLGALEYGEEPFKTGVTQEFKTVNKFNFGPDAEYSQVDYANYFEGIKFITTKRYSDQSQLQFVNKYEITQRSYNTAFVVILKDGTYDGLLNYDGIDGMSIKYATKDTDLLKTNEKGTIMLNNGGTTDFTVSLVQGEKIIASQTVTVTSPIKTYNAKTRYFAGYSDDAWTLGGARPGSTGSSVVGWVSSPGAGVEYHVGTEKAGKYRAVLHYATPDKTADFEIFINGELVKTQTFIGTKKWNIYGHQEFEFDLKAGKNDITFMRKTQAINIDALSLYPKGETKVNMAFLKELVDKANALVETDYDAKLWGEFKTVLDESIAMCNGTEKDQDLVDDKYYKLDGAITKLEKSIKKEEIRLSFIEGLPDGTFAPEATLVRAEAVAIFAKLLNNGVLPTVNDAVFSDVPADSWYSGAVSMLSKNGMVNGFEDGTFKPNQEVTRGEFATMIVRFKKINSNETNVTKFLDVKNHWAKGYVTAIENQGWINGYEDGTFKPDDNIKRNEAVKVMVMALGRDTNGTITLPTNSKFSDVDVNNWAFKYIVEASK